MSQFCAIILINVLAAYLHLLPPRSVGAIVLTILESPEHS
jgi:hypothetical protein